MLISYWNASKYIFKFSDIDIIRMCKFKRKALALCLLCNSFDAIFLWPTNLKWENCSFMCRRQLLMPIRNRKVFLVFFFSQQICHNQPFSSNAINLKNFINFSLCSFFGFLSFFESLVWSFVLFWFDFCGKASAIIVWNEITFNN